MSNEEVRNHYDNRGEQGIQKRNTSPILHLRNFNNWIKRILLSLYMNRVQRNPNKPKNEKNKFALDLCCGKMGDIQKWNTSHVQCVIGADIAIESLKSGLQRYKGKMKEKFSLLLIQANCTVIDISTAFPDKNLLFDICSCQFALHYAFGCYEHARMLIQNASQNLRKGGYFIGTIPNSRVLL